MSEYKFPASLPRKMYWSEEVVGVASCPDCGGKLESEQHAYLMATRWKNENFFNIAGSSSGYFCGECPVVVLKSEEFDELAANSMPESDGVRYTVLGMIDFDAVPEEKRHLPFGENNEPPLVQFLKVDKKKSLPDSGPKKAISRKRDNKKRKNRKRKR